MFRMTFKDFLCEATLRSITAEQIAQSCEAARRAGYGKATRLKGYRTEAESAYLRYTSAEVEQAFIQNLPHDTRYIGGSQHTRGRTVYIFEANALRVALEFLGLSTVKYANLSSFSDDLHAIINILEHDTFAGKLADTKSFIETLKTAKGDDRKTALLVFADYLEEAGNTFQATRMRQVVEKWSNHV